MKILIKVSYDGTNYSGWQVQPSADTVQERLENAIKDLTGEGINTTVKAADLSVPVRFTELE